MREPLGVIFDVDHFAVHDGPGIRTVVYFKGCPLRCAWCHSPESQKGEPEPVRVKAKCLSCASCAEEGCPHGAYMISGRRVSVSALCGELLPHRVFFASSGGGVTLSGGEVLYQPEFAAALVTRLREEDIHTVVETSCMGPAAALEEMSPFTDIFYCDIKLMEPEAHTAHTGAGNALILANIGALSRLREGRGITLRVPLIPGYTDGEGNIAETYRFAADTGLTDIHLLPYNASAPAKYEWLSRPYLPGKLERQDAGYLQKLVDMAPAGLHVTVV